MNMQELQQVSISSSSTGINNKFSENEPFWGNDGFTFGDVLDIFNPLHHIPIVSKLYQEQSHDEACEGAKLVGGVLFGGLFGGVSGVAASIADSAVRHETQHNISEHLLAMAEGSTLAEGTLAEGSTQQAEGSKNLKQLTDKHSGSNPFFAQMFQDAAENDFYSSYTQGRQLRKRNWGEV